MDHQSQPQDHPSLTPPFTFYPSSEQDPSYNMPYNTMSPYQVLHHGPGHTRHLSLTDLQHQQHQQQSHQQQPIHQPFHAIGLLPAHQYQSGPVYPSTSPHVIPISGSPPPPPSPDMYDPLSPPISGSDTSADGLYHHSNSSGANSPSSSRGHSLVHRHIRYNPTPSPTSSSGRRTRGRSRDSDDDDPMGVSLVENLAHSRKEATRRQRIEAEQRRRDELRDGYAKLKEVLPVSNQKSSKVSLLERATNHIVALEKANDELLARINTLEQELQRLRAINEKISLGSTDTPSPTIFDGRPLSPPPDRPPASATHSLTSVKVQDPSSENSTPSPPENGGVSGF